MKKTKLTTKAYFFKKVNDSPQYQKRKSQMYLCTMH